MSNNWDSQGQGGGGTGGHSGPQYPQGQPGQQYLQGQPGQQYPQGQPGQQYPQGQPGQQYPQGQPGQQYPQGQPGQQYPQGQPGQQNQAYGRMQDPYSQPGTPYQPGHGGSHGQMAPPVRRSSVLGIVGLGIVVAATVILSVLAWMFGKSLGEYILELMAAGSVMTEDELLNDPRSRQWIQAATGSIFAMLAACIAGLAGWIVSIVAAVQKRGIIFAVIGIILGVVALGIAYAAFGIGLAPAVEQLGR